MPSVDQLRTRLLKKLKELFQLDQPDLDFGFYRIMHAKAEHVSAFIETDLLNIIQDAFGSADDSRKAELQAAYEQAVREAQEEYGSPDPENTPKAKKLKAELAAAKDTATAEGDIYDHLYRFFERYYDTGDFISRRYYARETSDKAAPYAIPYNGEEVKLHWANADQYYIKTADYFTHFIFDLKKAKEVIDAEEGLFKTTGEKKVHFRVVDATEGAHGNVKEYDATKRFFKLHEDKPIDATENGELVVHFEYRPLPGGFEIDEETEKRLKDRYGAKNKGDMPPIAMADRVLQALKTSGMDKDYFQLLSLKSPTEKIPKRPLLAKYIRQYTARNTMDYFIHKDLGGFLRRELDFYIKNEVMRLDDIEDADAPAVETWLAKIKVLRRIAGKLIDFLAQLENFQKKLWLKKKFIVETNYCITLDRVPAEFYPRIIENRGQIDEWVALGFLTTEDTETTEKILGLDCFPWLVLDTRFFDEDFKARLIASIDNFDEQCDGILVHSENFQALNLLQKRYREQVKCVYIDPPYNTGGDGFLYKDSYQHASWLTMISERLSASYPLLSDNSVMFSSIDAFERKYLESSMDIIFGRKNRVEEIIWVQNTTKNQSPTYSTNHEYIEVYSKNIRAVKSDFAMFRESKPGYPEIMDLVEKLNPTYPPLSKVESALRKLFKDHKSEIAKNKDDIADEWKGIYNYNRAEYRDSAGKYVDESEAEKLTAKIWVWREDNPSMPTVKEDSQKSEFKNPDDPTFRFYRPIHPTTGKPCPHPKTGWRWPYNSHGKQNNCFLELDKDHRIAWGNDEKKIPQTKRFLHEVETNVAKSVINDYTDGEKELTNLFGKSRSFGGPKPTTLIQRFCEQAVVKEKFVCDFFAGSGTTGEAVINLNRAEGRKQKYLLIEMGDHFNSILKPRIAKVVFSENWKDGKPQPRHPRKPVENEPGLFSVPSVPSVVNEFNGMSHCFKYIRLESYEDTLNNLVFDKNPARSKMIAENSSLREDFMLRYLLDVETRGSQSLLNIDAFSDPTAYTLNVKKPGSDEITPRHIDLIETFNYLIGLRVNHMAVPQTFTAEFKYIEDPEVPKGQKTKLVIDGRLQKTTENTEKHGNSNIDSVPSVSSVVKKSWWFRKIEGWVPKDPNDPNNGQKLKILIVWRKLTGDLEKDNAVLDAWFLKNRISTRDFEFDTIYVNGSNNLPNLKREEDIWKVRLIEEEFMKRMWNVEGV